MITVHYHIQKARLLWGGTLGLSRQNLLSRVKWEGRGRTTPVRGAPSGDRSDFCWESLQRLARRAIVTELVDRRRRWRKVEEKKRFSQQRIEKCLGADTCGDMRIKLCA